ncbi:uncharacterized protein TNCV_4541641 [Trichonephila clavipes]|nr:uncharacterized protein TNCV_4541641 [Trichonephila clavipes]
MRSADLFLEVASPKQSSALRTLRRMAHIDITVVPHNTLNYSQGVISAADLLNVSTEDQKSVKAAYLHCPVRPYIPNPLRCFQCQRFGHSKTVCCGQPTCSKCAEARRVVSLRTPVSGKSYALAANKTIAIQVDASTAPKSEQSESVQPNTIAVDTRKTVATPPTVKKTRKTRIKESGCKLTKKRGRTSLKNPMTWETMSWKFMQPKATKV